MGASMASTWSCVRPVTLNVRQSMPLSGAGGMPHSSIHATSCWLVWRPAAPPYTMKLIQPSMHGQNARMRAPVIERPVM